MSVCLSVDGGEVNCFDLLTDNANFPINEASYQNIFSSELSLIGKLALIDLDGLKREKRKTITNDFTRVSTLCHRQYLTGDQIKVVDFPAVDSQVGAVRLVMTSYTIPGDY